ncbi:MAG: hypothetical protein PUP90_06450 [Nostoc sp. S4]|nr:hypothetical protein [Nostoc sp. S4]
MADVTTDINQTRAEKIAKRRIEGFAQQFGEAHHNLARHAAFPLVLTPDLLYQIWANFVPQAPWTSVAHVLLSRLCRQVGYEMYEMDIADRNLLLRELKEQFGQERFDELGDFLLDYVAQRLTDDDADTQDLREAQEWTALAYTKPDEAARELALTLSQKVQQHDVGEVLRLASLVETFSEPMKEAGFEPLLSCANNIKNAIVADNQQELDNLQQKIIQELIKQQMSFIAQLRTSLISDKQVYDLSQNEEFAEFNFIGLKETLLTVDLVAFTKADGLTEKQIVDLRDKFFKITQIVSYDFGVKPQGRMPNALLGLVFEDECPSSLIEFIQKQTKISNWQRSAVLVSWVIDIKSKQIHTHNNPVSLVPSVFILESTVFPGLDYLKSFISIYRFQSVDSDNDTKASIQNFRKLESRLEEIYNIIKTMPEQQSKYNFPNAKRVQIFEQVETYINNNTNEQNIKQSPISISNNIQQVEQYLSNNALIPLEKLLLQEAKELVKVMQSEIDACPVVISTVNQSQCLQCIEYLEAKSQPFLQIIARIIYHDHNSQYIPLLVRAFKIIANQALPSKNHFPDEKSRFIRLYPLALAIYVVFILGVQENRNQLLKEILSIQLNRQKYSLPNLPLTSTLTYFYHYSEPIFNTVLGGTYFVPVIERIKQVLLPWIDDFVLDADTAFYQGEFVLGLGDIEAEKPEYLTDERILTLKGAYLYHHEAIQVISEFIHNSSQWLLDLYPSLEQLLWIFDSTASKLDSDGYGRMYGFCRNAFAIYRGQRYY